MALRRRMEVPVSHMEVPVSHSVCEVRIGSSSTVSPKIRLFAARFVMAFGLSIRHLVAAEVVVLFEVVDLVVGVVGGGCWCWWLRDVGGCVMLAAVLNC